MRDDHPVDRLVVILVGTAAAAVAGSMRALSRRMPSQRWVLRPPKLIDESDVRDGGSLGFVLSIYTARPPWDEAMDRAIDRAHLDEVKKLLGDICRISGEHHVSFAVDFAGESIGMIADGRMDESLKVGLIGEWERVLGERDVSSIRARVPTPALPDPAHPPMQRGRRRSDVDCRRVGVRVNVHSQVRQDVHVHSDSAATTKHVRNLRDPTAQLLYRPAPSGSMAA